jgi:hypothetical protein
MTLSAPTAPVVDPSIVTARLETAAGATTAVLEVCTACKHPLPDHDAIAQRYCGATVSAALTRGCICAPPKT